ncbi:unnamed protein product [Agarophyton chilense]
MQIALAACASAATVARPPTPPPMAFISAVFRAAPRACAQPLFAPRENPAPQRSLSPQQRRLHAKRAERPSHPTNDADDQRRLQLAAETLSADDIAGIIGASHSSQTPLPNDLLPSAKPTEGTPPPTVAPVTVEPSALDTKPSPVSSPRSSTLPPPDIFCLNPGCLVVHSQHGIGRFLGLERTVGSQGATQEYAVVSYRDGEFMTRCLRVVGCAQVNRSPFPIDERAELTFAQSCPFRLTDDQNVAVKQILHDMSSRTTPMDRLLCGDVGFGKTEVAMRAAFRAIIAGKQVALLAPTTILAHQHYETFKERLEAHYPQYSITCLTRFVARRKVLEARQAIGDGSCHVAVGTHMLLGDSVSFLELGLLIVDEEHRFGVNQKEKIRERYKDVDTLSLSATPIPRTLHLALTGLRDTSLLREAPEGRKPIATCVCQRGAGPVRRAISVEMRRGGQVFFVVPRVDGIDSTAEWLRQLFPTLRVLVAHGQMSDVEHRVWDFASGKYDVLVCTTIIENGINMPDVNTIVVNDATRFGLAQLHQLRGRVGRSHRQAFAWFLYSGSAGGKASEAVQRLKTLEKYNELGSGFQIAQKDMEMRGVGTVLGVEQHGNNSVEAAEYAQMLAEELEHIRTGDPLPLTLPISEMVEVFLPVSSLIPEDFVPNFDQKMTAYSALSAAQSSKSLIAIAKRLQARYGTLPAPTIRHISVLELKLFAKEIGIRRIASERQHVSLDWALDEHAFKALLAFVTDEPMRARLEHLYLEERVLVRGLGMCSGDVQLAKIRGLLKVFCKAAKKWQRRGSPKESDAKKRDLVESLYDSFK